MTELDLLRDVADVPAGDDVERRARASRARGCAPPSRRRRGARGFAGHAAGPGPYFYSRLSVRLGDDPPATHELWLAPDGSGRLVRGEETIEYGGMPGRRSTHAGRIDYEELIALPTDVDALARYVDDNAFGRPDHAESQFLMVGELLRQTPVPPDLSRALFGVAERLPGVETAPAEDSRGRPGVRVSLPAGGLRRDLIRDADGVLLADLVLADGKVMEEWAVEERGVVDRLGERPGG